MPGRVRRAGLIAPGVALENTNQGKRVLVTGGGRGIGEQIVRVLAGAGYDVQFSYFESQAPSEALLGELRAERPDQEFSAHRVDLGDQQEVESFAEQIAASAGLYALIYNAGRSYDALIPLIDQDRSEVLMRLNFGSMTRLISAAIRPMLRAKTGRIIGISSGAAFRGLPGNAAYAASKGAMASYIRTLAVELARKGIAANSIVPGFVDTDILTPYAEHHDKMQQQIPAGRFAKPVEIANLINYLLSPEASYLTGADIPIDGGLSASISVTRYG